MKSFIKDSRGSFTFEATIVFPTVFLFTIIGVFFCIVIFQMGTAYYVAEKAASQVAYTWNNSNKDLKTGSFDKDTYTGMKNGDQLYWRLVDDNILGLFNLSSFNLGNTVENKMEKAREEYGGSITVKFNYNNSLIYSEVEAEATTSLYIPSFVEKFIGTDRLKARSSHVVTDSPELIRTFNFGKYLWSEFGFDDRIKEAIGSIKKFFGGG